MFRRSLSIAIILTLTLAGLGLAHDMFLKPENFFVKPYGKAPALLLNGTFDKSSNAISRPRIADLSMVGPKGRISIDTTAWGAIGDTSRITYSVGQPGTYVLGVSTKPSQIELEAKDFNSYLKEDGLPDELARRQRTGETNADAKEQYSKHVKAIIQVGEDRTDGFAAVLGYPAEIVPLENPYQFKIGGTLEVRVLVGGKPVAGANVLSGARTATGGTVAARAIRSDARGVARIPIRSAGVWYIKFINMTRVPKRPDGVTHESKWATLTFAVE